MHKIFYFIFATIIIYGIYNSIKSKQTKPPLKHDTKKCKICKQKKEFKDTKEYIIDVINNGSNRFNLKGGVMEGGYIPKEDAKKVACYVMTLSGKHCNYKKEAVMIYTSSCAGCHGVDGKGIKNTYPDLTKKFLLGMQK